MRPWRAEGHHAPQEPSAVHLAGWPDPASRNPEAVENAIGPDIRCWSSTFFIKEARDPGFVSMATGFRPIGGWSRRHRHGLGRTFRKHGRERRHARHSRYAEAGAGRTPRHFRGNNLLTRGQEIAVDVDGSTAVTLSLEPGEMSLHHVRLIYRSDPTLRQSAGSASRSLPSDRR